MRVKRVMQKAMAGALCALLGLAAFLAPAPALAAGTDASTAVSFRTEPLTVIGKTDDFTLGVGESELLRVTLSQTGMLTYAWQFKADNGTTWTTPPGTANAATYTISNAQVNSPATMPYQYRVTVTNTAGESVSAIIKVLVSNDYTYGTVTQGGVSVTTDMLAGVTLSNTVVTSGADYTALQNALAAGKTALAANQLQLSAPAGETRGPSFGQATVVFTVGAAYNGQTLRVLHKESGAAVVYTGTVANGLLSISLPDGGSLKTASLFMVEAPASTQYTITASAGAGGSVSPAGAVRVSAGGSKTFVFTPDTGKRVQSVRVDGAAVALGNSYTFTNVTADHTLTVTFEAIPYTPADPPVSTDPPTPPRPTYDPQPTYDPPPTDAPQATPPPAPVVVTVPVTGQEETILPVATVIGETAEVHLEKDRIEELLSVDIGAETVTVDVSQTEAAVNTVVLPVEAVSAIAQKAADPEAPLTGLEVVLSNATVAFDASALNAIATQAREDTVTLHVEEIGEERLTPVQLSALRTQNQREGGVLLVEVTLRSGNSVISGFHGGSATVRLPYAPAPGEDTDAITVWHIAANGSMEQVPCTYADGYVSFTVSHFSNYAIRSGPIRAVQAAQTPAPTTAPISAETPEPGSVSEKTAVWPLLGLAALCALCFWFLLKRHGKTRRKEADEEK